MKTENIKEVHNDIRVEFRKKVANITLYYLTEFVEHDLSSTDALRLINRALIEEIKENNKYLFVRCDWCEKKYKREDMLIGIEEKFCKKCYEFLEKRQKSIKCDKDEYLINGYAPIKTDNELDCLYLFVEMNNETHVWYAYFDNEGKCVNRKEVRLGDILI